MCIAIHVDYYLAAKVLSSEAGFFTSARHSVSLRNLFRADVSGPGGLVILNSTNPCVYVCQNILLAINLTFNTTILIHLNTLIEHTILTSPLVHLV